MIIPFYFESFLKLKNYPRANNPRRIEKTIAKFMIVVVSRILSLSNLVKTDW